MNDFLNGMLFTAMIIIIATAIFWGIIGILNLLNLYEFQKGTIIVILILLFLGGSINYMSRRIKIKNKKDIL